MRFFRRSRAMKDKHASVNANCRLAKAAAAMREEVVDNEEDVVPYQHIGGGEVGETIRYEVEELVSAVQHGSLRGVYTTNYTASLIMWRSLRKHGREWAFRPACCPNRARSTLMATSEVLTLTAST